MKEKVVIYARFSSEKQNEQSIDGQLRYCTAYATQHQMEIVHSYIDRATSGRSTKNRDEFLQMIEDSKKRGFSKILVWKLDRFARNRYDAAIYRKQLEQYNVKLVSVTENMGDGPEALIMEAIVEAMAQMYSQVLSQNVIRGMRESALNGQSTGGVIPLGYKIQDKKLTINYETAPAAKYIFESFLNGISYKEIADNLNNRGYKTTSGKAFNKNSFHRLLKNPVYIGTYQYMDIIKENAVPAIIDKDTFDKVQAKLAIQKAALVKCYAAGLLNIVHQQICNANVGYGIHLSVLQDGTHTQVDFLQEKPCAPPLNSFLTRDALSLPLPASRYSISHFRPYV